jgi:hypothetical protein
MASADLPTPVTPASTRARGLASSAIATRPNQRSKRKPAFYKVSELGYGGGGG